MKQLIEDPYFRVEALSKTINPQQLIYAAMHQDYSEEFVFDELQWVSDDFSASYYNRAGIFENDAGERIVKNLLKGNRGHYGPLEHPQIVLNIGWFPHSAMQQFRTHRVGVSFDVQSGRYTSQRIIDVAEDKREVEEVFYLRPVGDYVDRQGDRYTYSETHRNLHLERCRAAALQYRMDVKAHGLSEEHARGMSMFDIRQHWVMSCNLRSLMHLLLIRGKKDAQPECQQLCWQILPHFEKWCPEIYEWFFETLWLKGRLAP